MSNPLIEVGKLTLDRNLSDFHTEMEQAALEPNKLVPGIGLSPDKMLLAWGFSYADAHRARLGVNYKQIPVNRPKSPVHSYSKDGAMRLQNVSDSVYVPNSYGGRPKADPDPRMGSLSRSGERSTISPRPTKRWVSASRQGSKRSNNVLDAHLDDAGTGSVSARKY